MAALVYDEIEGADLKMNGMFDDIFGGKIVDFVREALQYLISDCIVDVCLSFCDIYSGV